MKAKRFFAVLVATIMLIGLMPIVSVQGSINASNKGVAIASFHSESPQHGNWGGGYGVGDNNYVEFDVTVEGLHTITLPPWQRDDTLWVIDAVHVFFLSPTNPTAAALPVSVDSIAINGEPRVTNRGFSQGASFWLEVHTPRTLFGIDFEPPARSISSIPGYTMHSSAVNDIKDAVEVGPWLTAGASEMLGTINRGDVLTVNIKVGGEPIIPEVPTIELPTPDVLPTRPAQRQLSDFPEGTKFIALTFDDGPNTSYTVQILDELKRLDATATFYVNPHFFNSATLPIVYRMISEGHDVDNHGWNHKSFGNEMGTGIHTSAAEAIEDLKLSSRAIFNATGYWPFSFRAPFFQWGGTNDILMGLDRYLNMPFVDSGMDTNDWQDTRSPQDIANTVLNNSNPDGGIVLMHDGGGNRQRTVDSLKLFIPEMRERGYEFVSVRELMMFTETMPQLFAGRTSRPNQWAPIRSGTLNPLWDTQNWWEQDWWTDATPPWERGGVAIPTFARKLVVQMDSFNITADGVVVQTMDVLPVNIEGRTLLPVRFVGNALGADTNWNPDTQTVTITLDGKTLSFTVGESLPGMDVPATIIDGRTMVPLRFIGEFFGADVSWVSATRSVEIVV
jgi:peptidoglycan/xylan/chitin deacetylase (PgdA/CDA1 family)